MVGEGLLELLKEKGDEALAKEHPSLVTLVKEEAERVDKSKEPEVFSLLDDKDKNVSDALKRIEALLAAFPIVKMFDGVFLRLEGIENQLATFNEHWAKRQEMYDLQMSILQKFDLLLTKEKGK